MSRIEKLLSGPLFFLYLDFVIFIAFGLLSLDQGVQDLSFEIVLSMDCLLTQILLTFIFSSYADNLTLCSSNVANSAYGSLWYKLPLSQRSLNLMIIRRSQRTFYLNGFKMFFCSMQTFQEVKIHFYYASE